MARGGASTPSSGFALVEALVSLVIVAMIGLMLIEGVGVGRRVWERIDARDAAGEAVDGAQTALRERIEEVYAATLYDKNPPYVDFNGGGDVLAFLAPPPQSGRPAPLRRYYLSLTAGGDLVLSSMSDVAADQGRVITHQILLSGVRSMDLAYFGAAEPDQARRWRGAWTDQPLPPELVRIRLTFEPGDPRRWPDLIIRPRATIDTNCFLSPISHRCKGRA